MSQPHTPVTMHVPRWDWDIQVCVVCNDWSSGYGHPFYTKKCPGKRLYEGLANQAKPIGPFEIQRLY